MPLRTGPQLESVQVTGVKTPERDGYWAVQLGARDAKPKNVNKPQLTVFQANNVPPKRTLQEFRVSDADAAVPIGTWPTLPPRTLKSCALTATVASRIG